MFPSALNEHEPPDAPALQLASLADCPGAPAEKVRWLWPGRIPLGKLTILEGDPGLGKSLLTLDAKPPA